MSQSLALALTLAIEVPVVLCIAWFCGLRDHMVRVAAVAAAASLLTHPFAWYLALSGLAHIPFWTRAAIIEFAVIIAEAVVFAKALKIRWRLAFAMSIIANLVSFGSGIWIVRFL